MSKQTTLITALSTVLSTVLLMAAGASQAAPAKEGVVTLPRVVVTGKAVKEQSLQVVQLPRVVVTGYTVEGQLLAQAKPAHRI